VGFLLLIPIPMILADAVPQNLRSVGLYAAYPLVIGLGAAQLLKLAGSKRRLVILLLSLLLLMVGADAVYAFRTYNNYWGKSYSWVMFDRELPHGEWFFRTDRRDFARWLADQDSPLLVPINELNRTTVRAWLMEDYPLVESIVGAEIVIPPDTRLVIPWNLEGDDLLRSKKQFALIQEGVFSLLPRFTTQTHQTLLADIDNASWVIRDQGELPLLAHVKPIPENVELSFVPMTETTELIYDDKISLAGWSGPDIIHPGEFIEYTLFLEALQPLWRRYDFYVALYTQAYERKAWDHNSWQLSWLYPTYLWQRDQLVSEQYGLRAPDDLQPGAYRLVAGANVSFFPDKVQPASLTDGTQLDNPVTVAWLKVPQLDGPTSSEDAARFDAILANAISLESVSASWLENGRLQLSLFWKGVESRPTFDATIFIHILDAAGTSVAQIDDRPWGGQYPTFIWDENEVVQTVYDFDLAGLPLDSLFVGTGMYVYPDLERLPVIQNGERPEDNIVRLGSVESLLTE
jgi:hypothetical protein